MRYFVDTEFLNTTAGEEGWPAVILLSIGVVAEDGREYYAWWEGAPWYMADTWVKQNVIHHFMLDTKHRREIGEIRDELRAFVGGDPAPEFWTDYGAFDSVVVSQLMGGFEDWPESWPMWFNDLRQASAHTGAPIPDMPSDHHALHDARQLAQAWQAVWDMPLLPEPEHPAARGGEA